MSHYPCAVIECPRSSRVLCYCCTKNFCIEHIRGHNEAYLSQLHQLTNEVNDLSQYLRGQYREQLDQWRHQSHQTIDLYYEKKCQALESASSNHEKFVQNRQVIEWIQLKIMQLICEQSATEEQIHSLQAAINAVRRELEEIPREDLQLKIPPLILTDDFIQLDKAKSSFSLHSTIKSTLRSISLSSDDCIVMANSSTHLLIGHQANLYFYDLNLKLIRQTPWEHGCIRDMCMSSALSKFFLVAETGVFTLDEQTMTLEQEPFLASRNKSWYCCACSEKSLFLTMQRPHTTIREYTFAGNTLAFKQKRVCCAENEYIEHMKCSRDALALVILNEEVEQRRFEVRSLLTFDQLWTISLPIREKTNIVSCCALDDRGWLIVDLAGNRLIYVTPQGQIEQSEACEASPLYAVQFGGDSLAVLTERGINLHRIE